MQEEVASSFLKHLMWGKKENQYQPETTTYLSFKPQHHHKQDGVSLIGEEQ